MSFGVRLNEMQGDGQWWVKLQEDAPLKCAIVGSEVSGWARFIKGQGLVKAEKGEHGASNKFSVNVYDGKKCRVLTGSKSLYRRILGLNSTTAGLDQIWVEIFQGADTYYGAKYAGDLTEEEIDAIAEANVEDLHYRCPWADDEGIPH